MSLLALGLIFLQKYLVPFLFTLGLLFFFYAAIEYFIVGKGGDEERSQHGRELFLKSIGWLVLALVAHLITLGLVFVSNLSFDLTPDSSVGGGVRSEESILPVPNVPGQ